jgi:3-hydroxyisobutyrate dehydrogenase-like beta-hydroxyacid dehydrogenase
VPGCLTGAMARLGFCGLGQMGAPMAARLVDAGHHVTVWNRTADRAAPLVERGAKPAASPAEAAAGAEGLFTMVSAPDALDAVLFGDGGAAAALGDGATLIEMSTVGPAAVHAVRSRLPDAVGMLDAPVLGSVPQATDGSLEVFVGGDPEVFQRWEPVLAHLGHPVRVGPLGAGASMKLVANSTLGALMTGLAEALALADGLGLDQAAVLDVLAGSPIGVTVRSKRANVESGRFSPPNFKLALAVKDLGLVADAAAEAGVEVRIAPAARSWLEDADRAGLGRLDYSAVIAHARGRPPADAG